MAESIYEKAKGFQFGEPRETLKLFRLEEMRKLKNRGKLNDKAKMKDCEKKLKQLNERKSKIL